MAEGNNKTVYLMRGLPSCGKSFTARRIAGELGVVLETDEYFHTHVGTDPAVYDYDEQLLPEARRWNFERFQRAIQEGVSPIVVDRGNGLNLESQRYARYARDHGYSLVLQEPDSEWWQEIRVLLKYKHLTGEVLDRWAEVLAKKSRQTHRVPASIIRRWMQKWRYDLTIDEILDYEG
jgi:predicted kinase